MENFVTKKFAIHSHSPGKHFQMKDLFELITVITYAPKYLQYILLFYDCVDHRCEILTKDLSGALKSSNKTILPNEGISLLIFSHFLCFVFCFYFGKGACIQITDKLLGPS